jgi:hypothetical protein
MYAKKRFEKSADSNSISKLNGVAMGIMGIINCAILMDRGFENIADF